LYNNSSGGFLRPPLFLYKGNILRQYVFAPWEQYDSREDERRFNARMRRLHAKR
jgi:hypothetical protein